MVAEEDNKMENTCPSILDLKRLLDSAVREYENAITRTPTDENEIRIAVDRCASARKMLKEATMSTECVTAGSLPECAGCKHSKGETK